MPLGVYEVPDVYLMILYSLVITLEVLEFWCKHVFV